jgi:hypothetical protein
VCMRAEASDAERPCVTDVESLCAVSCAERRECAAVIDYSRVNNGPFKSYNWGCRLGSMQRTEGVALRLCGSGGCSIGDAGRKDLEEAFAAL